MATASLLSNSQLGTFNQPDRIVEGWYWVIASDEVPRGKAAMAHVMGQELAVYRTESGRVVILDAKCKHRGAHLGRGEVSGETLRCPYHRWQYGDDGSVVSIPCQAQPPNTGVSSWPAEEKYGLIWVYTGAEAKHPVPSVPELEGEEVEFTIASRYTQACHPNVVMLDAIDVQHFHSVHRIEYLLDLDYEVVNSANMRFVNTRHAPRDTAVGRFLRLFYKGPITYELSYWFGSTGTVTLGPDFAHFHTMFANRLAPDGTTEGLVILVTRRHPGLLGKLRSRAKLAVTKRVVNYFGEGDTPNFASIQFDFQTPIKADKQLISFIQHIEAQPTARWGFAAAD